ncbi:acyl-CoA/acyl-ACP dehydrogenase [Arthrobacter sp. MSA 4-2]|uniref:acyl-CoA dehydrogenase family protein n=1 Tax=Arthrobacter sp. MSA 4-2 TaxID=2794349 RepID=UPI0018E6DBF1|nr:acyl-CoA dehydrogenase family protein [Arthrobacter sp. MSA 4-2]MBJ2119704.1 acyl-CoA/acyl-ACP dehydrogenase [Arthrobacter sp. MSA 4-2]
MEPADLLTDGLLERFRERAPRYDAENTFFTEDLADLKAAGYLRLFCAVDDGGSSAGMRQAAAAQRRLAAAAPATALGINMHLVWTAIAALLRDRGDDSLGFILSEAASGEIFAFGISEPGNDAVLFDSTTAAEPGPDGSLTFTGTKIFTSLSPAWTRLGVFGKEAGAGADGEGELVHAFVPRDTPGVSIIEDWNPLGMRASQSNTTRLEGVRVPSSAIFRRLPVGPNADPFIFAVFAAFESLISAVYAGIADRALELSVEAVHRRTSRVRGISAAQDPVMRHRIAAGAMRVDALDAQLRAVTADLDAGTDHGPFWFAKLVGLKTAAVDAARRLTETGLQVSGGSGYAASSEIARLHRDALAGQFHPSNEDAAHNTVASAWLGPLES